MRDLAFSLTLAALSTLSLVNPFAGMIGWGWISFAQPASSLWGFATVIPANLIIAITTMIGWTLNSSTLTFRIDRTLALLLLLAGAITLSTIFSLSLDASLTKFKEYMINFLFVIMLLFCLNSKIRIDAIIWLMVICICYYSFKGGLAFLVTGGAHRFEGPAGTAIGDNNHLALAFLLSIPLLNYLRLHAANALTRKGVAGLMVLTILAVLCTQSRGGFIGLVILGGAFWWTSGRRVSHLAAGLAIVGLVAVLTSEALVSRWQTIETAHEDDQSFLSRVVSWQMHLGVALDRPLVGAGPYAIQTWPVFTAYRPEEPIVDLQLQRPIAAHSIYFQILGDHGFVAFALYIALLWTAWRNAARVQREAAGDPKRLWMVNLAGMTRLCILTFAVTGAALSMAFYDYFMTILALTACLLGKLETSSEAPRGYFASRNTQQLQHAALHSDRRFRVQAGKRR